MDYDVFISHASEDKQDVARPLAERLNQLGLRVWLDESELVLGDSLRRNIDSGLSKSKYGVVILSNSFFEKEWTQKELDGLVAREDGKAKVILPIWHNVTVDDVKKYSPVLADKLGVQTNKGLAFVAERIIHAIDREASRRNNTEFLHKNSPMNFEQSIYDSGRFHSFGNLIVNMLDGIQSNADQTNPFNITRVPTGFVDLDYLTSGLQAGNVVLLASRPTMGKTDFLLNIASYVAIEEQLPVVVFSLDHSAQEMMNRFTSIVGSIDSRRLAVGMLLDDEWPRLTEAVEKYKNANVLFDDKSNQSIEEINSKAKLAFENFGALGLIIIDSIQLIHRNDSDQENNIANDFFKIIKNLAKEINCPIVITSQIDRRVELRVDKRPILSDMGDVGGLDRYVDTVIFLYRNDFYNGAFSPENNAEIIVARQKRGPPGTIELAYSGSSGKYSQIVHVKK